MSNFDLTIQGHRVCFDAPGRGEHDSALYMPLAFLVQKLFAKISFFAKAAILTFFTSSA